MLLLALAAGAAMAAPAGAEHVACGDRIARDTRLDSNLRDCPGDGLVITANGVTIDFAGHTVDGTGAAVEEGHNGISVERHVDRFTLVRGTVRQFVFGVVGEHARGRLRAMRILDNSYYGVAANSDSEVRNSVVSRNEAGVEGPGTVIGSTVTGNREYGIMTRSDEAAITNNVVRRNGDVGIVVEEGAGIVARNVVTDNVRAGINWNFSTSGAIRSNVVARNGSGISLDSEADRAQPIVERNAVARNRADGIHGDWEASGAVIARNDIRHNGGNGIVSTGESPCPELRDNVAAHNGEHGVLVTQWRPGFSSDCVTLPVTGNTARGNAADGIHVAGNGGPVTVARNRTDRNGGDGIDVDAQGAWSTAPDWSPDGQQIAFSANPGSADPAAGPAVYLSAADGGGLRRVGLGEQPDWAPDGRRIAFVNRAAAPGVYTVRPDGSGLTKVAASTGTPRNPKWSPDGGTLLYEDGGTIYSVAAAGGSPTALTSGLTATDPEWSPDGTSILFDTRTGFSGGDLYVMGAAGGSLQLLAGGHDGAWSPFGSQVVFARDDGLWVIRADGAFLYRLTPFGAHPRWSPDTAWIAFTGSSAAPGLHTVQPDGGGLSRLAAGTGRPDWSPDSSHLAVEDGGRVAVVARDGSGLTHVPLLVNPLVTVRANHAAHNAALGIRSVADVADGGGNRARHNGDPRQCLGVSCH